MKKENVPKKRLLAGSGHPLLDLKEVMDAILKEAEGLPAEVRQTLVQARDAAWKAFAEGQEKINNAVQ
jgi:hypothetical protein